MDNVISYINEHQRSDYQRVNFDSFLKKIKFSFNIPAIHVAGTNGKGSVCHYLANIYHKAGYRVGLFTSPSVISFNEVIKVNGEEIRDEEIKNFLEPHQKLIDKYDLSSFEILAFVAFEHFKNQMCDIAIIECGMGGEEDATNVFTPILSIITSVSLEHTAYLGKSLSEIATNKAGIIKREVPVLIGELDEEATNAVVEVAKANKSKVYQVAKYSNAVLTNIGYKFDYTIYHNVTINSFANYSVGNASIALEATLILNDKFSVNIDNAKQVLLEPLLPGRLQYLSTKPLIIVDGAHNPEAMEKLENSLEMIRKEKQIHIIFASFRDKNIQKMLNILGLLSQDIILTEFDHPRCRNKDEYFLFAEDYKFESDYLNAINSKIKEFPDDIILITGSLAFAGRVINDYKNGLIKYEDVQQ